MRKLILFDWRTSRPLGKKTTCLEIEKNMWGNDDRFIVSICNKTDIKYTRIDSGQFFDFDIDSSTSVQYQVG